MRIDAHQHFWRYDPAEHGWIDDAMAGLRRDFLPADLEPLLRAAGFDGTVAVQTRQSLEETRFLLELADAHAFVKGVVGWVDLQSPDAGAQLQSFAGRRKLVGIRHLVQDEPDEGFMLRSEFGRGLALLEDLGLAYDVLIHPRHLPAAAELAARFPRQRFVLDHLAKPPLRRGDTRAWERGLCALAKAPNVWAKLSGLVTEAEWDAWSDAQLRPCLDTAFECFGAQRLMIGSDWPVCTLAADYRRTLAVVTDYLEARPRAEAEAVLGGNAARFWRLA